MIDNEKHFKSIERIRRYLIFLSAVAIAVLAYWNTTLPVSIMYPAIALIVITIIIIFYYAIRGFAYFAFENIGDVLIFKYYSTGNFSFKRMKISVSRMDFAGYEICNSLSNLRTDLVIFEWMNDRKAAYPPLNISALSAKQKTHLQESLQKFIEVE